MATVSARLERIKDDTTVLIDPGVVERACGEAKHTWRKRVLDPVSTLKAFALQILHGNTAMAHVVQLAGGAFSESAYCQGRARLPVAVVRAVLEDFTARAGGASCPSDDLWCGHRVTLIDGTGVNTPDSPQLRGALGVSSACAAGCGLPMTKVLTVFKASDGLLLGMHAATAMSGDLKYAHDLHPALVPGDVLVGDRGLCAYTHLAGLKAIGCHGVFRMASGRSMPFPARNGERRRRSHDRHRHSEPILVKLISFDDQVVEIVKPHNRPKHMTPEAFAKIPGKLIVRAVKYTAKGDGVRTRQITLLTTLTDYRHYSAQALAELYLMRWRVEVNIRHLKRTMGMDRLKCQSVDGVARELMMFALIYNAVCRVRAAAARRMDVDPMRLSFIDTLRAMLVLRPEELTKHPPPRPIKRWPLRPPRIQTRQIKRKHSNFHVMTSTRERISLLMKYPSAKPN